MRPGVGGELRDSGRFTSTLAELLGRGYAVRFRAHGSSMFPAIRDGELVTVAPVGREAIRVGDVIVYRHGRGVVAHRVVRVRAAHRTVALVVRGDAVASCDAPIALESILGKVVAIGSDPGRPLGRGFLSRVWCRLTGRAFHAVYAVRATLATAYGSVLRASR